MKVTYNYESMIDNYFISSEQKDNTKIEIKLNCIYCFCPCLFDIILIGLLLGTFFIFLITKLLI